MKIYLISLAVWVVGWRVVLPIKCEISNPPFVALCGLLGMVIGEQLMPMIKNLLS
ncbi:DUF1427 family protein [Acinetobacter guillouiae]|uniref:DUF1427 family protein n=1 Tax=Acinetobacter guillouiae TaxID=106649 RepID=UPI002FDAB9D8